MRRQDRAPWAIVVIGAVAGLWSGRKSANQLTISAQDPISKIPEYKVCAVRVRKADAPPAYADALESQQ
jgi:assimilatory nitrate reductase catalytic subunit